MKRNVYDIVDTMAWSASGASQLAIPRNGFITHLENFIQVTYTEGGSLVMKQDHFARLLRAARLEASGRRSYFSVTSGLQWYWFSKFQYGGRISEDTPVDSGGTPSGVLTYGALPLHFGTSPLDLFDRTIPIPAVNLQDLTLSVDWAAATAMGTDFTITAAKLYTTVYEVVLEAGDSEAALWPEGIVTPRFESAKDTVAADYDNYSYDYELPVGDVLHSTLILARNATSDARSDAHLTQVGVNFPRLREQPWQSTWRQLAYRQQHQTQHNAKVAGAHQFKYDQVSGRPLGLDLTKNNKGDATLGFSVDITGAATNLNLELLHFLFS